jgi:hypothetical protein
VHLLDPAHTGGPQRLQTEGINFPGLWQQQLLLDVNKCVVVVAVAAAVSFVACSSASAWIYRNKPHGPAAVHTTLALTSLPARAPCLAPSAHTRTHARARAGCPATTSTRC